jgi:hypothetical protein
MGEIATLDKQAQTEGTGLLIFNHFFRYDAIFSNITLLAQVLVQCNPYIEGCYYF